MSKRTYSFLVMSGAFLWGLISLFSSKLSFYGISPKNIVAIRSFGATIVLALLFVIKDRSVFKIELKDIKYFIGTGIISFVLFNWCLFVAMKECSAGVAVVLLYTAPIIVTLLSALLFKERLTKTKMVALVVTAIGCVFVTGIVGGKINGTFFGIICGLGSGFFYALYSIFSPYALKKYSPYTVTLYTFIFAAIASLFIMDFGELAGTVHNMGVIVTSILIVLISTVSPFLLYTKGLSGIEAGTASILATIEPAVGVFVSVFILHQPMTFLPFIGVVLILGAVILLNFSKQEN